MTKLPTRFSCIVYESEVMGRDTLTQILKEKGAPVLDPDYEITCTYDVESRTTEFTWWPIFRVGDWVRPDDESIPYFQIKSIDAAGWPVRWNGTAFSPRYLNAHDREAVTGD